MTVGELRKIIAMLDDSDVVCIPDPDADDGYCKVKHAHIETKETRRPFENGKCVEPTHEAHFKKTKTRLLLD